MRPLLVHAHFGLGLAIAMPFKFTLNLSYQFKCYIALCEVWWDTFIFSVSAVLHLAKG